MITILKMPNHYALTSNNNAGEVTIHFKEEMGNLKVALKLWRERPIMSAERQMFSAKGTLIQQQAPSSPDYVLVVKHQGMAVNETELDSLIKQIEEF